MTELAVELEEQVARELKTKLDQEEYKWKRQVQERDEEIELLKRELLALKLQQKEQKNNLERAVRRRSIHDLYQLLNSTQRHDVEQNELLIRNALSKALVLCCAEPSPKLQDKIYNDCKEPNRNDENNPSYNMQQYQQCSQRGSTDKTPPEFVVDEETSVVVAEQLIASGADPKWADEKGTTPLHAASANLQVKVVEILIHKGADVNAADKLGRRPLHKVVGARPNALKETNETNATAEISDIK